MIDRKIIAMHQWIVDESERKPAWWVEQLAWAFIAAQIAASAFTWKGGWDVLWLAISLIFGTVTIIIARSPALLSTSKMNSPSSRQLMLAISIYLIVGLLVNPDAGRFAHLLGMLLMTSWHYFAACEPPRPKKRRQTATQGAT